MQSLSVDQLCKGQLVELSAILDNFYASITSDYIAVEVGGGEEPQRGGFFHMYKLNTSRWSHLRPIWVQRRAEVEHVSQFIYIVNLIKQFYIWVKNVANQKFTQYLMHLYSHLQSSPPSNTQNSTLDHVFLIRKWWHEIAQEWRWSGRTVSKQIVNLKIVWNLHLLNNVDF